jgi:aldose 1-epimerase
MASPKIEDCPISFLPLGAIIQSFTIGGQNIVLGFPDESLYRSHNVPYFGETIGRYCNRISDGKVVGLNSRDYEFVKNERGSTSLHGGIVGWGKRVWHGPVIERRDDKTIQTFSLRSEDGDQGFPGEVEARVRYTVQKFSRGEKGSRGDEEVVLDVDYEVRLVEGQDVSETIVAVTNHGFVSCLSTSLRQYESFD